MRATIGHLVKVIWSRPWVRFFFYGFMGLWAIAADPFRISSATDRAIGEQYSQFYSRTTPVGNPPVTVVIIDRESIDGLFNGGRGKLSVGDWPIAYSDHAAILTQIAKGKPYPPVGIFYDILFEKPRLSSGRLELLNRRVELIQRTTGIPVFFAAGGPDMPLSRETLSILSSPSLVRTNWHQPAGTYPLVFSAESNWNASQFSSTANFSMEKLSPAISVYETYCSKSDSCEMPKGDEGSFRNSLKIQWPMASEGVEGDSDSECLPRSNIARYIEVLQRIIKTTSEALFNTDGPALAPTECLPIHVVQASDLFSDIEPATLLPPGLEPGEPYVVMVGVVMPSAGDYHRTPVYGKLPGVFFHAAAFENLHRMGRDYYYHKDLTWLSLSLWFVAAFAMMCHAKYRRSHPITKPIPVFLGWWVLLIGTVLTLHAVLTHVFRIVPEGWLSMVAILPLLREVVMRHEAGLFDRKEKNK